MWGVVKIEAESIEGAIGKYRALEKDMPLPEACGYVEGSLAMACDDSDIEEVGEMQ